MEGTRLSSFELPDHWIPFYGVGLQFIRGTGKRFYFQCFGDLDRTPPQARTDRADTVRGPPRINFLMRAFGADDGKPNRTPSAWMMTRCIAPPFPVPFSARVTSMNVARSPRFEAAPKNRGSSQYAW